MPLSVWPVPMFNRVAETSPLTSSAVAGVVYEALVAPPMAEPFLNHW